MTTLNKIILRTAVEGLVWTVIAFCYGLGIFAMCFPGSMAQFYDLAGNTKLSAMYYGRVYDRSSTNQNLFFALSKSIEAHNNNATIKYGNIWFFGSIDDSARNLLTSDVDDYLTEGLSQDSKEYKALTAYNTDFRLRRGYIVALMEKGKDYQMFLDNCPNKDLLSESLNLN